MERQYGHGPRFHRDTAIPDVPSGMELVKFHGQPALIPTREEGELMYGRTRFTVRQVEALMELERDRRTQTILGARTRSTIRLYL